MSTSPTFPQRSSSMNTFGVLRSDSQLSHRTRHLSYQSHPRDAAPRRSNSASTASASDSSPRSPRRRLMSIPIRWFTRSPPGPSTLPASDSEPATPNLEPQLQSNHSQAMSPPRFIEQFDSLPPSRGSVTSTAATPSFYQKRTEMDERLKEDMKVFKFQLEPILSEDNLGGQTLDENEGARHMSGQENDGDPSSFTTPQIQIVQPTPLLPDYTPYDPHSPLKSPREPSKLPVGGLTRPSRYDGPSEFNAIAAHSSSPTTAGERRGLAHQYYYPSSLPSSPATASGNQSRGDAPATPNIHTDSGLPSPPPSKPRLHRVRHLLGKSIQEPPKLQEHKIDVEGARVSVPSINASPRRSIPPEEESPEIPSLTADLAEMGLNSMHHETHTSPSSSPLSPRKRPKRVRPPRLEGDLSLPESSGTGTSSLPMNLKLQSPAFRRNNLVEDQPFVAGNGNLSDAGGSSTRSTARGLSTPPAKALLLPGNPSPKRTLDLVRNQVAQEMALRVISKSKLVDGVQIGIADASSASSPDDIPFVHMVAANLASSFLLTSTPYLFIITIATTFGGTPPSPIPGILYITSSSHHLTERAIQLSYSKFIGRIASSSYTFSSSDENYLDGHHHSTNLGMATRTEREWIARIKELHVSSFDSDILYFILTSASRIPLDPNTPPKNSKSIQIRLAEAQARLQRITPRQAYKEMKSHLMDVPTVLVDIRSKGEREEFGGVEGSVVVERNWLEWKLDPRSEVRLDIVDRYDLRVIVFDQEGVTSSLAAVSLQKLGLLNATDVIGGFGAWKEAMLPVVAVGKSRAKVSRIVR
ncbi:hypothetical protein Agabi119p4_10004 [Agaricus bisporus var. burnettii]|uniref:Rhodanese domain-containing protein n=1 Tax=Agaricus bisporus var. burnettii TaxID=192524 RepID=A0A8H7EXK1_AGABI|nr:hypothetical protein Agabi119p4_10004 [Agaricus bisporus var. burnettii]